MIKNESKELLEELILIFNKKNIKDILIYLKSSDEVNINIYNSDVDRFTISDEKLIFVEGNYNGYLGYTYFEKLDKDVFDDYADNLISVAKSNNILFNKKDLNENIYNEDNYIATDYNYIIEKLKDLENYTLSLDNRVLKVMECSYYHKVEKILLKNDKGIEMLDEHHFVNISLEVVAKCGDIVENVHSFRIDNDFENIDLNEIANECVNEALSKLEIEEFNSGNYPVILKNNVVAEMISCYISIFSGDFIEKDMSLLKDKLNKKIATKKLSIIECPTLRNGKVCRTFDDEGTKTSDKYIIKNGILENIFTNIDTSILTNNISTGNGFKRIYKENIAILPTNLYVLEGELSLDEMIETIDKGVLITSITGLHAGINSVSGDFSLSSAGYLISKGKVIGYIGNITIAGNIYNVLNNIESIGKELKTTPKEYNFVIAPSIKINKIAVTK